MACRKTDRFKVSDPIAVTLIPRDVRSVIRGSRLAEGDELYSVFGIVENVTRVGPICDVVRHVATECGRE